jgi:hypothetical protein
MDIKKLTVDQQQKWLQQRNWREGKPGTWIDPDTRVPYCFAVALDRAIADCRIDSDMELKPEAPPRKDDSPPPVTGSGPNK